MGANNCGTHDFIFFFLCVIFFYHLSNVNERWYFSLNLFLGSMLFKKIDNFWKSTTTS